ncbi:MAG: glycoside hydrolase family 99-like domain-containing protein [Deltaproteobacteria bacterium]|nr:glycoside hydrolase family 99-like domain-containing protein [Deltaproteobacteria bacterium]
MVLAAATALVLPRQLASRVHDAWSRTLVGAYYYVWFPENWKLGWIGDRTDPPIEPVLGKYSSLDPKVAEQHIRWATEHGIDFFVLSWWPQDPEIERRAQEGFLKARNLADIKFCLLYESQGLAFHPGLGTVNFGGATVEEFLRHFDTIADRYFTNPSYLRIDGRPVVMLYITRTYTGLYPDAIHQLRRRMRKRGFDLFLVGDEIFWKVKRGDTLEADQREPVPSRVQLFDAITSYNLYEGEFQQHRGYRGLPRLLADSAKLYRRYREASGSRTVLFPQVLPGYNDRVMRLAAIDHFPIPRRVRPSAPDGSTLATYIERLAHPFLDPRNPVVLVTSFNEWNEGSEVEPTKPSVATSRDTSRDGTRYTSGFPYAGYGTSELETLRDAFVAVTGRVRSRREGAAPLSGIEVSAWLGAQRVAAAKTTEEGVFTLSRRWLESGRSYRIVAQDPLLGPSPSRVIDVVAGRSLTEIDFEL